MPEDQQPTTQTLRIGTRDDRYYISDKPGNLIHWIKSFAITGEIGEKPTLELRGVRDGKDVVLRSRMEFTPMIDGRVEVVEETVE